VLPGIRSLRKDEMDYPHEVLIFQSPGICSQDDVYALSCQSPQQSLPANCFEPERMNHMKIIRLSLLASLVLIFPASLLSSTESQLQTDLSGVLTVDFYTLIFSQSNLQVTAAGPAIVRGPNQSLVNTLQVSFPINGGAINQRTLRGELTREVW
jgi:hypothetical protein